MFATYCRTLAESFYNPRVYRDALWRWQGFGGLYLGLLSALFAVVLFVLFNVALNRFEQSEFRHMLEQLPAITIDRGGITVEGPQPVVITSSSNGLTITVDTTKSESELRDTGTQIGVGKNFVFMHIKDQYEVFYTDRLRNDNPVHLNKDTLTTIWQRYVPSIRIMALPLVWGGQFINLVVAALLVAFLSYFLTTFLKEEYSFLQRMRLAVVALTPATIISMVLKLVLAHHTAPWFPILLAMLYLYVMLMLMRRLPAEA